MELLKLNIQQFASGIFTLGANGKLNGQIRYSSSSNGSSANSSNVTGDLYIYRTDSYGPTTGTFSYTLQVGNKTVTSTWYGSVGSDPVKIASVSATVGHNNDGTGSAYLYARVQGPNGTSMAGLVISNNTYVTLDKIARQANITSAPDFNDEGNPTVNYSNPAGNSVSDLQISIYDTSGQNAYANYRAVSKTGSSYQFNLTDEERTRLLRACTSNTMQIKYYLSTKIGGTNYYSSSQKTFSVVNANPIFNNFVFEDINEKTLELTGNNQDVVIGYSDIKVTIPVEDKASAIKEATMSKYRFICGNKTKESQYSDDSAVDITINGVTNSVFDVYAIDSRNNSKWQQKLARNVINYNPLIKENIIVSRANGVSEFVNLNLTGKIDLVDFGEVTNSIKNAEYIYKRTDSSEWSEPTSLELTVDENGNFSFNDLIAGDTEEHGFDIGHSYQIQVDITDELSTVQYTATFGSGIPNIALHKQGVGIMGKYDVDEGGLLQVAGKDILKSSCCRMITTSSLISFSTTWAVVSGWNKIIEEGDYEADTINNRLIIRNTKICEISAATGGRYFGCIQVSVLDENNNLVFFLKDLFQFGGNTYWASPLRTSLVKLDPTKTYYVKMEAQAYNASTFEMNHGFGNSNTYMQAKKIE